MRIGIFQPVGINHNLELRQCTTSTSKTRNLLTVRELAHGSKVG